MVGLPKKSQWKERYLLHKQEPPAASVAKLTLVALSFSKVEKLATRLLMSIERKGLACIRSKL